MYENNIVQHVIATLYIVNAFHVINANNDAITLIRNSRIKKLNTCIHQICKISSVCVNKTYEYGWYIIVFA